MHAAAVNGDKAQLARLIVCRYLGKRYSLIPYKYLDKGYLVCHSGVSGDKAQLARLIVCRYLGK